MQILKSHTISKTCKHCKVDMSNKKRRSNICNGPKQIFHVNPIEYTIPKKYFPFNKDEYKPYRILKI